MAAGKASGQSEEDFASLTAEEREVLSGLDRYPNGSLRVAAGPVFVLARPPGLCECECARERKRASVVMVVLPPPVSAGVRALPLPASVKGANEAGCLGRGDAISVAVFLNLSLSRFPPFCSRLFGFLRLHEDGARTKALLLKVRGLRVGEEAATREPPSPPVCVCVVCCACVCVSLIRSLGGGAQRN